MEKPDVSVLLQDLAALPAESEWVEFKVNNAKPQEIGEYISALSNSACYLKKPFGYLVFGIENEGHNLVGTTFKPKSEKIGNQELENWLATQLSPKIDFSIFELDFQGMHFALFKIPATANTPVSFKGEPFIRVGSYKKPLDDHPEKERAIWNRSNAYTFERVAAKEKVTENEIFHLIDCPAYFEMAGLPLPGRNGILDRLIQDKMIFPNGGLFDISNLGAILFARDIEQFEHLERKAVRVILYDGRNRVKTKKEQRGKKGYAAGFVGLVKFICDALPTNEVIDRAIRKEVPLYPPLAIRELVANAIIHQDFSIAGSSPMVEIFENRIEISNPGKPLIDPFRFLDHSPESRNEVLARCMRRLNICEERGSGIDKVVFECELHQLPAPEIVAGDNYTRVTLFGHKTFKSMDKQEKVRACYLHACLKYVSGEQMTNLSLRQRFGIAEHNYAIASRIIGDTLAENLIKYYDPDNKSRKYARYQPFWV